MAAYVCGPCGEHFANVDAFRVHACSAAQGATPEQPEYLIRTTTPNFDSIAKASQDRAAAAAAHRV